MKHDRMSGMVDASICLLGYSCPTLSGVEVGNGIIELLSWRCEGQIPGQAVLLTNLFLVWNSCGCNISIATCGAGDNRALLPIAVVNLDALFHDAFCRNIHLLVHCILYGNF